MTTIDPLTGVLIDEAITLPARVEVSIKDDGLRSLMLVVDVSALGDEWVYDSVIDSMDGELTVLFYDETDE
jgi:hypothetical protein